MNFPTALCALIIAVIMMAIVHYLRRRKREGKTSCGCGSCCSGCPSSGICHAPADKAEPAKKR